MSQMVQTDEGTGVAAQSLQSRPAADCVWERLHQVVEEVPGWSPVEQLFSLYQMALLTSHLDGDILEIGSWCGRSTIAMALACSVAGAGTVHAVDLFPERDDWFENLDGTFSFKVQIAGREYGGYQVQTVWKEPYRRDILPLYARERSLRSFFEDNLKRFGIAERVRVWHGDSTDFARGAGPDVSLRFAFVDGDHGYHAVCADIDVAEERLIPGGWLSFDDAFTSYEGVNRALLERIVMARGYDCTYQPTRKLFAARRPCPPK